MTWCLGPIPLHPIGQPWPEDDAYRIRDKASTATTSAVRQQLADKARQLDDLADGLDAAALNLEQTTSEGH